MTLRHPGANPECPECQGTGVAVGPGQPHATATACPCVARCPACGGTGFVSATGELHGPVRRCTCTEVERRMDLLTAAGIPSRHATSTRVSFQKGRDNMPAFTDVSRWIEGYRRGADGPGLVLWGPVGRGKTHLMVAALRELVLRHGVEGRFVEFALLLADLRRSFERRSGTADLLDRLTRVEVLAIDELGMGRKTEWEDSVLDELVSRRYNEGRVLLATTNYEPHRLAGTTEVNLTTGEGAGLVDRVGPRIHSRLVEMCHFVEVRGEDWRERLHPRGFAGP